MDTRNKRSSAINVASPWRGQLPAPDGAALDQGDRQHANQMYRGILAEGGVIPPEPATRRWAFRRNGRR